MSNLGGGGLGGLGGLGGASSVIPTIDTGKSRRMAGRPTTAGKSSNINEPPTLSKALPNSYGIFGNQDDISSTNNRIGTGIADRGSGSKPANSGIFGQERSNSPTRDPVGLE
jgi:hypothetical protein